MHISVDKFFAYMLHFKWSIDAIILLNVDLVRNQYDLCLLLNKILFFFIFLKVFYIGLYDYIFINIYLGHMHFFL